MLTLHLVEQRRGVARIAVIELGLGRDVERIHVMRDVGGVLGLAALPGTSGGEGDAGGGSGKQGNPERRNTGRGLAHGGPIASLDVNAK